HVRKKQTQILISSMMTHTEQQMEIFVESYIGTTLKKHYKLKYYIHITGEKRLNKRVFS
ncbi:hypothetical protein ACJX0J_028416, partial [Zea mays]